MLALALSATGLGMILSVSYVRYRDVRPIWEVILQMTFYASGIFTRSPGSSRSRSSAGSLDLGQVLMINPFAAILSRPDTCSSPTTTQRRPPRSAATAC